VQNESVIVCRAMNTISKINIKNYRSCVNTNADFKGNLTTLIGINGAGKSNILNAIRLLKSTRRNRYLNSKIAKGQLSHSKLKFNLSIEDHNYDVKADVFFDTDERNQEDVYSSALSYKKADSKTWVDINYDLLEIVQHLQFSKRSDLSQLEHIYRRGSKMSMEDAKTAVKIVDFLSGISYYSATQFSDPSKCPVSIELEDGKFNTSHSFRSGRPHEKFLFDLYTVWNERAKNPTFDRYLNTVNQSGIGLIEDIAFLNQDLPSSTYVVRSGGRVSKVDKNREIIVPSITLDGLTLSPNQLSEGTFKTLVLVFYILADKSDLLLIEEPEVCVHHGLLNSIIELLKVRSKNKQIIISTHSDFVLDHLSPENLLLVSKKDRMGTIAKPLSSSLSKNDYVALKEYLNSSGNLGEYWKEGGFEYAKD
jgi:predicted ATPase